MKKINVLFIFLTLFLFPFVNAASPAPGSFNVYSINDIGQNTNSPYGNSSFQGTVGAGGNVYMQNLSVNSNGAVTGNPSLYAGQNVILNAGQVFNGGIEAGGNITTNNSTISGNINGGNQLRGTNGSINGNVV